MKVEHRRDARSRIFLKAMLRWAEGGVEVRLTDLSSLGACANSPVALATGTPVQISRGDLTVLGQVAWAADGKLGIEFADPLNVSAFHAQGKVSADSNLMPLHQPVERVPARLQRHWAEILKP